MTIIEDRLPLLDTLVLESGGHNPDSHYCVMEAVAYIAGEPWSDHPACVSPVIGALLRSWNDSLDDETRQKLKPYITKVIGTRGTKAQEGKRAWMATDWLARECAPAFLRAAGLTSHAETLENLAPLTTAERATTAQPKLAAAWDAARTAVRTAAKAAAWAAAGDAAWTAARTAARTAAGDAAWDAARAAARTAARAAAKAAAWAAAGDAAWAAAGDAAWAAAWDAAGVATGGATGGAAGGAARTAAWAAAWAAAGDAAWDALAPTISQLQASAFSLLDRMIAVTAK